MEKKKMNTKTMVILLVVSIIMIIGGVALAICCLTLADGAGKIAGMFGGFALVVIGMTASTFLAVPFLKKFSIKTTKYIQETNREDLEDIATTSAEIGAEATTITAQALAQGLKEGFKDTKFCKHCGSEIDKDSKFCPECGGQQ